MPLDLLPNDIPTPTRDEIVADYKRDYAIRNENIASTDALVDADAQTFADNAIALYGIAKKIGNNVRRSKATGDALVSWLVELTGSGKLPATGASGIVSAGPGTALGGATIFQGDTGRFQGSTAVYQCMRTDTYSADDPIPIQGVTTGPATDQPAGAIFSWDHPRPGQDPTATVLAQADGSGLSGGLDVESDEEAQLRLDEYEANPPASGNEAEYIQAALRTPGVPVGAAFVYGDLLGPGSICLVFTLRIGKVGANRIPNGAHIAAVAAWLKGQFPSSDALTVGALVASPLAVILNVTWAPNAPGWTDLVPYPPPSVSGNPVEVMASPAPTATAFSLDISGTSSSGPQKAPAVGAVIGFYDVANKVFRRKQILAVGVVGTVATVTCNTSLGASDTTYTPFAGQLATPWSDSLNDLGPPVQAYFDGLGPGEQIAGPFDPGLRQRRVPLGLSVWPNVVNNRVIVPVEALPSIEDAVLSSPTPPYATPVGTPGVSSNLITLQQIAAFPE